MVVGLSSQEWRLLVEKTGGSERMQMITGVEEAIVRGLSQSESTPDTQTEVKNSWNAWALKLCDGMSTLSTCCPEPFYRCHMNGSPGRSTSCVEHPR